MSRMILATIHRGAMDEHQDLLQWAHLNFSYNHNAVWKALDIPLHPGAARYNREQGYMK